MALKAVLTLLWLLVAAVASAAEEGARPWWWLVPDSYDGRIFSGGRFADGATEFHRDGDGLAGSYAFVESGGGQIDGALEGCRSAAPYQLACRWRDRYGGGDVLFIFRDDLQSFSGLWFSPKTPRQGMPWTGARRLGS